MSDTFKTTLRRQYIKDDTVSRVRFSGNWTSATYDTKALKANPSFYHNWGKACRLSAGQEAEAEWRFDVPEDGDYTVSAWWASAPAQATWAKKPLYEVAVQGVEFRFILPQQMLSWSHGVPH